MVERKIIWSQRAKSDLFAILDFYFQRNGTKAYSSEINVSIRKSIRLLSRYPNIGKITDVLNVRNLIHGDYLIFYEIKPETIEILTIWDNRQNPEKLKIKL
jgi:toxin YoeB